MVFGWQTEKRKSEDGKTKAKGQGFPGEPKELTRFFLSACYIVNSAARIAPLQAGLGNFAYLSS